MQHLEALGLNLDVHGADSALVHRKHASNRHHTAVLVEDPHLADVDGIRTQIDRRIEAGVRGAKVRNRESAAADVDDALEMRVVAGPSHFHLGLKHASHVGHIRRKTLDDAKVDLAARYLQLDSLAFRGCFVPLARLRMSPKKREGGVTGSRQPCRWRLLQSDVHVHALAHVVDLARQRFERKLPERALIQDEFAFGTRRIDRTGDGHVSIEPASQALLAEQQLIQLRNVDVFSVDAQPLRIRAEDAVGLDLLIPAGDPKRVDLDAVLLEPNCGGAAGNGPPFDLLRTESGVSEVELLMIGVEYRRTRDGELALAFLRHRIELELRS